MDERNNNNSPSSSMLHTKFKIQGPWNLGQPVHERITEGALKSSKLLDDNKSYEDSKVWEFIRGVLWNDDPEGLLFDNNDNETKNWSSGVTYGFNFEKYKRDSKSKFFSKGDPLLARSHFGDLQCFHAMASKDNIAPQETLGEIMEWCYFLFQVSKGGISGDALLKDTMIKNWFPDNCSVSVKKNYLIGHKGDITKRAIGSLMHIVQDSYAKGHVARDEDGKIVEFHCYTHQNEDKHGEEDELDNGKLRPEAVQAMEACAKILLIWLDPQSTWDTMKDYLSNHVFVLSPQARPSGPGEFK